MTTPSTGAFARLRELLASYPVTGGPLYSYRLRDEDFHRLQELLGQLLHRADLANLSRLEAASLCIFGAEWWRRHFAGGPWSWDNILRPIHVTLRGSVAELYPAIHKGLKYWSRQVRSGGGKNLFLATLAMEGGLPLNLVLQEGQWLRRYLRKLMEQFKVYQHVVPVTELARDLGAQLPQSLRHNEVYELAGRIVEEVLTKAQGWQERLPFSLDDAVASELLKGLMRDAEEVGAGRPPQFRITTWLDLRKTPFALYRTVDLSARIQAQQLQALLDDRTQDLPPRVHLFAQNDAGTVWLLASLTRLFEQDSYIVEPARGSRELRLLAEGRLSLWLRFSESDSRQLHVAGGQELGELPWIFEAPSADTTAVRLLAEGRLSTRRDEVYVAQPMDAVLVALTPTTEIASVGPVTVGPADHERRVLKLRGSGRFGGVSAECVVRTEQSEEEAEQYVLRGRLLHSSSVPVYLGPPELWCCREDGLWRHVPTAELQFSSQRGRSRVQRTVKGVVRYQSQILLLPASTEVKIEPGRRSGTVEIAGLGTQKVAVLPQPSVQVQWLNRQDRHQFTLSATGIPPQTVKIQIAWGASATLALDLPFPVLSAWFVDRDGEVVPEQDRVSLATLRRLKLSVTASSGDLMVTGRMDATSGGDLRGDLRAPRLLLGPIALDGQRMVQSLDLLGDRVATYFSAVTEHDTPVQLTVTVGRQSVRRLDVVGYAGRVHRVDAGRVVLEKNDGTREPASQHIRLEAMPLWDMEQSLPLTVESEVYAITAPREPGSWLVVARNGETYRPCVDVVLAEGGAGDEGIAAAPLPTEISLRGICNVPSRWLRRQHFERWYQQLVENPVHSEWRLVMGALKQLDHASALWLDLVRDLTANPEAVAMAALRIDQDSFRVFFTAIESLPFLFATMPVRAWVRASESAVQCAREAASAAGLSPSLQEECATLSLYNLLQLAPRQLHGLRVVAKWVEHLVMGGSPIPRPEVIRAAEKPRLAMARQALFCAHSHEHWYQWTRWSDDVDALKEVIPAPLHDLLDFSIDLAEMPYRIPVVMAPMFAALASAAAVTLSQRILYHLRIMSQFDPLWFETAHEIFLCLALSQIQASYEVQK